MLSALASSKTKKSALRIETTTRRRPMAAALSPSKTKKSALRIETQQQLASEQVKLSFEDKEIRTAD